MRLATAFGQFEGVEHDKTGGKSSNRGEHAKKCCIELFAYTCPTRGGVNIFAEGLESSIDSAK